MNRFTEPLRHPLCPDALPERAEVMGYYYLNGRHVGLRLEFADGHTASLTYDEIEELQRETAVSEEVT